MKNTYLIIVIFALVFCSSCNDDEFTAPNPELSDVTWYTSIVSGTPSAISIGDYVSFLDASQGTLSHEWHIEEDANFLMNTFKPQDSLPLFIDSKAGLVSNESTVHVLFTKPGINKVMLRNTFSNPVTFQGTSPISSVPQGDVHLFENVFEIDVYDKLKPAFKVFNGANEILSVTEDDLPKEEDVDSWPTITIEAGSILKYVDMTTYDRPNARMWGFNNGVSATSTDSVVNVTYFKLGETTAGWFRSIRNGDLPNENVLKVIPLKFEVIPSAEPFLIDDSFDIVELVDEKIVISLSGEAQTLVGQEGNFTVHVTNSSGFDQNIPVKTVSVDLNDATKLILELDDLIYNTDTIEVSFQNGSIISVDNRVLEDFGPTPVVSYVENLYPADVAGFEAGQSEWEHEAWAAGPTHTFETAPSSPVYEGDYSMRLEAVTTDNAFTSNKATTITYEAGKKYSWSYKLWIDPSSTATAFGNIRNPPWSSFDLQIGSFPKGEWIDSGDIFYDGGGEDSYILIQMFHDDGTGSFGSGSLIVYIDNLLVYEVEDRP